VLVQVSTDELEDMPTEELESPEEEFNCSLLEENSIEDELSTSDTELLFPLSLSQAAKIKATATIPNNVVDFLYFICYLLLTLSNSLFCNYYNSQNSSFNEFVQMTDGKTPLKCHSQPTISQW